MSRWLRLLPIALVAYVAVVSMACEPRQRRTPDDTLVVLFESSAKTADPRYAASSYDAKVSRLVAPGLVTVDSADMAPRPELAESFEQVDELTWRVTIRADARFSDGTPVTAEDVAWTFGTVIAKGSDSLWHKGFSERFKAVVAEGTRTVRFELHQPLATFLTDLDMGIIARHGADPNGRYPGGRVLGAGPYRVEEISGQRVVLRANPHWHGGQPGIPTIVIKNVRDAAARLIMLAGGSADLSQNAFRYDLIDDVLARERVREVRHPSNILTYMMLNNEDAILKDARVRRAIALALDRETLIRQKFAGRAVLATSLLPPSHWCYTATPQIPHDLAAAMKLLDEAGYPDPDGPGGRPRFTLVYKTSADQFRVAIARVIASQLGKVGIAVDVRPFEFATFFADIKKGVYQIATMQTSDITEPDLLYTYFHSSRIPTPADPNANNRWRYRNALVDERTEQGRRVSKREERIAIYADVQRQLAEDLPIIPLWHEDNVAIVNADVVDFVVLPNARLSGMARARKLVHE
ncbi:MAG: ABC transporter substrate-binding protein [Deltaproteobacteria bacterium]|nr:ABC transporter substrate-binding protein [Kofleriaceae bacterium]